MRASAHAVHPTEPPAWENERHPVGAPLDRCMHGGPREHEVNIMKRILVAYATREGQARKVAEHVSADLQSRRIEVDLIDVKYAPAKLDLGAYAHVVLVASIHLGKHEREMLDFVRAHRFALDRATTSLLSVSMSEAGAEDPQRTPEQRTKAAHNVQETIDRFMSDTGLYPSRVMPVAGALKYREYGWLVRFVMKRISKAEGGPTDTSRDYEMTDWVALDRFADEVAATAMRFQYSDAHGMPPSA
jgi:menaquinone-dependent protoporphyrinogen oxidase